MAVFLALIFVVVISFSPDGVLSQGREIKSNNITVFVDANSKGASIDIDASKCISPLPDGFDNAISSINTKGNCVNMYKELDCNGEYIIIKPGTPAHEAIHDYPGFHDSISSIGPCNEKCHRDNIEMADRRPIEVTIFDHDNFKGNQAILKVKDCVVIPKKMKLKTTSVRFDGQFCIELHEHWNCTGDSIQLRRGTTPLQKNIARWGFNDKASSISFCGYNCNRTMPVEPRAQFIPAGQNYVTLYSEPDFKGDFLNVNVSKGCVSLSGEWEGEAESLETYGTCVYIYSSPGCDRSGKNRKLMESANNLRVEKYDFDRNLRSIESCASHSTLPENKTASSSSSTLQTVIFVILGLSVFALAAAAIIIIRLRKSHKRVVDILTEKEIQEFIQGIERTGQVLGTFDDAFLTAHSQPYDHNYEVPKHLLSIDMQKPLGAGEYAVVYPGRVKLPNCPEERHVAVKTTKPYCGVEYVRAILKEIKTMIYVGPHPRIVELVGCHTENLRNAELYVMTQLCSNGSMEKFLQNNRDGFINLVEKGELQFNNLPESDGKYENIRIDGNRIHLSSFHIFEWSLQIAEGMEYLASKKVIHGDLATRNVLLDDNFNAKISDFGLSKQLYEYTQYVKKNQAPLPWRYLALESLRNLQFSTQSDIWAYGVTVWEIFTLGDTPYPGIVWGESFMSALDDGFRLPKPKYATSDCYSLMLSCWREKPSDRIPFTELRMKLEEIVAKCKSSIATSHAVESKECNDLVSLLG